VLSGYILPGDAVTCQADYGGYGAYLKNHCTGSKSREAFKSMGEIPNADLINLDVPHHYPRHLEYAARHLTEALSATQNAPNESSPIPGARISPAK
jgi:hypothetical protein